MKILKRILLIIVSIVVIALIVALFINKDYSVQRSITVNKPVATVFNYIKYLKNQHEYSKWARMDPAMKTSFSGTDATPGFVSSWESDVKDVGKGSQKIVSVDEGKRVEYEIHFIKPFESDMKSFMETMPASDSATTVKWNINGKMNYPMNLMKVFMSMDKMLGGDLETGLTNLKGILERKN